MDREAWLATAHGGYKESGVTKHTHTHTHTLYVFIHYHIYKILYIHTQTQREYDSVIRKKEIPPFAIPWMGLEHSMPSEKSQRKKNIVLTCEI